MTYNIAVYPLGLLNFDKALVVRCTTVKISHRVTEKKDYEYKCKSNQGNQGYSNGKTFGQSITYVYQNKNILSLSIQLYFLLWFEGRDLHIDRKTDEWRKD